MAGKQEAGQAAEERALALLQQAGLRLVTRNFRTRRGEIDLVMRDGNTLVFVEVRYRSHRGFGGALLSIDRHKRRRLIAAASAYLQQYASRSPARFDVVAINGRDHSPNWIRDAFGTD